MRSDLDSASRMPTNLHRFGAMRATRNARSRGRQTTSERSPESIVEDVAELTDEQAHELLMEELASLPDEWLNP